MCQQVRVEEETRVEKVLLGGSSGQNSGVTQGWRSMFVNVCGVKATGAGSKERREDSDLHEMMGQSVSLENSPSKWRL